MPEKTLTEADWKSVVKGKDVKDDELVKALGQLARAEKLKAGPAALAAQREALAAVEKAADGFARVNAKVFKADKALVGAIADIGRAVERARKGLDVQAREAERAAAEAAADEDDETPEVLTTKMIPLIRQVRQGQVVFAKVATTGKHTVLLLSRKSISPARRKLLTDHLGQTGGVKFIDGQCLLEQEVITFVVASQAAGLAKKLKKALFDQTGLRLKLRVRGDSPDDVDEAGDEDEVPVAPPQPVEGPSGDVPPPAPEGALPALQQRLKALLLKLQGAIAAGHPQADALKRQASEAGALVRQARVEAAEAALASLEALLASSGPGPEPGTTASSGTAPARFVNQAKSRLVWQQMRQKVQADLAALERAILAHYAGEPDLPELAVSVRRLDGILAALDESLADTLDEALNAPTPDQRAVLHERAREILAGYLRFVDSDPLVKALDSNPFLPLQTHTMLTKSLQVLDKSLA